eukprot:TRINITY_DN48887_c0_g2_i1.p1 TRINITY_DN48887_c0_g2~~TRINITY_DN48887_c0_g2_i1.p1  ORF type:complete len:169 (+),score=18.81 TRINITY_DN48887_c0_g2_i1:48-509(+)
MGAGHLDATGLVSPGLTYDIKIEDYVNFLAGQNLEVVSWLWPEVTAAPIVAYNLNRPTIAVSRLSGSVTVTRTVTNVEKNTSTYTAEVVPPNNVDVVLEPSTFEVKPAEAISFRVTFTVVNTSDEFSFGSLTWTDDAGHSVRSVLAVQPISLN